MKSRWQKMIIAGIGREVLREEIYVSPFVTVIKFELEGIQCQSMTEDIEEEEGEW